jgi:predicted negative regulator of RcsB-dependent stress response
MKLGGNESAPAKSCLFMKIVYPSLAFFLITLISSAKFFIVKDGEALAEIVLAEDAPRSTRFAARDLQTYIEKMTGAKLAVLSSPSGKGLVKLFVGESEGTMSLNLSTKGLEHGAYQLVSGSDWLAFLGDDTDFVPKEPWAKNNGDRVTGKDQREWEQASGTSFGVPNGGMYKNRERMPADLSREQDERYWNFDERGSFNAVCGFLKQLGVRWYLPGELGEVVPKRDIIALPKLDTIVKPDFPLRQFSVRFGTASDPTTMWMMRLGTRNPYGLMIAHGMHTMTHNEHTLKNHPDWFALYGGKRAIKRGERLNHLCYSNPELFKATVQWARAQFDVYDYTSVSIMPPDAYGSICQCDLCEGKQIDDMGSRGKLSNHVWDFANRVAKEVGKTHPKKKILCCAYGANTTPPTNVDKLEPNVQVMVVGGRRPRNTLPKQREAIDKLQAGWRAKTDNPLMIFENYPFSSRGFYLPAFVSKVQGESINELKGISVGEDIWLSMRQDFDTVDVGFNHFQVYFTARAYWGGKAYDPVAELAEYCRLFYGPAGKPMQSFFEYCEPNYQAMEKDRTKVDHALALFAAAKAAAPADSVYAKRLALIDRFLNTLRSKSKLLGRKRGPVPYMRTTLQPKEPIVIDGKLDDQHWERHRNWTVGKLRELQTGAQPVFGTTVMSAWDRSGQNLYFAIRCDERPGEKLNIATTKREDQSLWYGDCVEILLETDSHSYYQLAVNPSGALADLDRGADKSAWFRWESQAEVATQVTDDHWTVEIRIPVTIDENDPLNFVVGRKPSVSLPWYFNVCRQRIRESGAEYSAFSPTGTAGFHAPRKFAQFYDGHSHKFDFDPEYTDYLVAGKAAEKLLRARKHKEALDAYTALAATAEATELQQAIALRRAASVAWNLKDYARADELAARIPVAAVAKTVRMENLLSQRKYADLLEQFSKEDFSQWPFPHVSPAAFTRARAQVLNKNGPAAEADLQTALALTSDKRLRSSIIANLGHNRETNLKDEASALIAYRQNFIGKERIGGADEFRSVQQAARILSRQGKHDDALQTLAHIDLDKTNGSWLATTLAIKGDLLVAAKRPDEARVSYRKALAEASLPASVRKVVNISLAELIK